MLALLGQAQAETGTLDVRALRRLLRRVGYYTANLESAFMRWAEENLPLGLRPYGITVDTDGAHIHPIAAIDVLITQARTRESRVTTLLWSVAAAGVGAIAIIGVNWALQRRRRR